MSFIELFYNCIPSGEGFGYCGLTYFGMVSYAFFCALILGLVIWILNRRTEKF